MMGGTFLCQPLLGIKERMTATYNDELLDPEPLDRSQVGIKVKLGQDDDFIATPCCAVRDNDEAVDVAHGQESELNLGLDTAQLSADRLVGRVLENVSNDIAVGYHDCFLLGCQYQPQGG